MSTSPVTSSHAAALREKGKKAVHVKWAGKTIALGTFLAAEADEKCVRAKTMTRTWRSTMRPKPTREWVMQELERQGIRVVSGRLGRKAGEEGDDDSNNEVPKKRSGAPKGKNDVGATDRSSNSVGAGYPETELGGWMGPGRRNTSLGISMLNEDRIGPLNSIGPSVGLDPNDGSMPSHRPLVSGSAAPAYEAARHDRFAQKNVEQQRRATSLGLGTLGGGLGNIGMTVNPSQHYEMLKLHHMNLLNEIQETTLMMNLYQQQQLQQQQQQLQQQRQANAELGLDPTMTMLGGGGLDIYSQRSSLGLGGTQRGSGFSQQLTLLQHQQQQLLQGGSGISSGDNINANRSVLESREPELNKGLANEQASDGLNRASDVESKIPSDSDTESKKPMTTNADGKHEVKVGDGGSDSKDADDSDTKIAGYSVKKEEVSESVEKEAGGSEAKEKGSS